MNSGSCDDLEREVARLRAENARLLRMPKALADHVGEGFDCAGTDASRSPCPLAHPFSADAPDVRWRTSSTGCASGAELRAPTRVA